ncbi:short-chain dehydrogenase [Ephemerocybe angulata]|uniref:Short-chain dehydrogenase n=1 Tax=Ephemerocybe angulata TaxID=980116 RepID=A0A8H6MEU7_9AGAR|nr:short-chain dehydrogenase [Tulosesus angulatus]
MKKSPLTVYKEQFWTVPAVATADLRGLTVVITGANTGLGFEAAKHFASMGPGKLVLGCRSEIKEETGCEVVELRIVDMGSFASVRAFADSFEGERVDIFGYKTTADGWEESLQINDIATALLCLLLTPRLVETGDKYKTNPRLVVVSSDTHYWVSIPDEVYEAPSPWKELNKEKYVTRFRYLQTKLLDIFIMQSLAELLQDTRVIVTSMTPGYCASDLDRGFRAAGGLLGMINALRKWLLARTSEQGARQIVYAAVGSWDDPEKLRGTYLNLHEIQEPSDHAIGEKGKRRRDILWADLVSELSKVDGRVARIVKDYSG